MNIEIADIMNYQSNRKKTIEIKHISEAMDEFIFTLQANPEKVYGTPTTFWKLFNQCYGGMRGELITLTAETGNGKSTWARNWLQDCVMHKIPSLLISLEDTVTFAMHQFAQMEVGKPSHKFTEDDFRAFGQAFESYPFYYLNWKNMIEEELLFKAILYAIEQKKTQFIVVDHLDYVIKKPSWSNNESYVIGDFLRRLASIAHEYGVTILLIVHPAKLSLQGTKRREVGIDELKGSSSIKQESDAVFGLFRENDGSGKAYLRFLKIRNHLFSRFLGAKIQYRFDSNNLRFEEDTYAGISYD